MTKKFILLLAGIWWGWTVIIDFVVVPSTFKIINDFFNAGELGITLFSKLNNFEVVTSSLLIVLCLLNLKRTHKGKLSLVLSLIAWVIVMIYFTYLTPKITTLTSLWKEADAANALGTLTIKDIQQEHQFFHRLYVALDTIKFLILSLLLGMNFFEKEAPLAKA